MAESGDRELDTLLADHADLRAAYRAASVGDEPAAALDAAILAASRKAVKAGPGRGDRPGSFMRRLAMPLSAAAVMVLTTSLSFLVYEERGAPSPPSSSSVVEAPMTTAATEGNALSEYARRMSDEPAGREAEPPRAKARSESRATGRPAPVPMSATTGPAAGAAPEAPTPPASDAQAAASAARAVEAMSERAAAPDDRQKAVRQADAARAMAPPLPAEDRVTHRRHAADATAGTTGVEGAPASAVSMAAEAPAGLAARRLASPARDRVADGDSRDAEPSRALPDAEETPAEWIIRVRALVAAGRIGAAREEIARLRCRYPDVTLPPDLPAPEAAPGCPSAAAKEGSSDLR